MMAPRCIVNFQNPCHTHQSNMRKGKQHENNNSRKHENNENNK